MPAPVWLEEGYEDLGKCFTERQAGISPSSKTAGSLPFSPASGSKQPSWSLAKKRSQSRKQGQAISIASKAWAQSFRKASHVERQGLIILSSWQGEASTEQPTRRISGEHSPLSRPWMTLRRRYSAPDSASIRVRWPRILGNIVLEHHCFKSRI